MRISILTATYNRQNFLERLYESIVNNVSNDYEIEWLIMDDGSTDNTNLVCQKFENKDKLRIKYYSQSNQGKMMAINNLTKHVSGDIWIECDSDDFFVEGSIKKIVNHSKVFQEDNNVCAMLFLKQENDSEISGNMFNKEDCNTKFFDLYFKQGITGEKIIVFKTDIRKKYKYPIEDGEKFCTEARLYHMIDKVFFVRGYNEKIICGIYHNDRI